MEHLQEFNLVGEHVSRKVRELEQAACQQLTLDLIMSSDIFSETTFSQPNEVDNSLETMTKALSLRGDSLPEVKFGYLRPLSKRRSYYDVEAGRDEPQPEIPMGVRCLLKEWDNNDPDEYIYQDPYEEEPETSLKPAIGKTISRSVSKNKHPPKILTSKAIPLASREETQGTKLKVQSQTTGLAPYFESQGPMGSSQTLVASSQVVPGPSGARSAKKAAKKRLGGF